MWVRCSFCVLWALSAAVSQTPEGFFQRTGDSFRGTSEEQQLFWKPHVAASHRYILEAAQLTRNNGAVIVLGAGVCSEIPLEELAHRFERVILADLDGLSMVEAVEQLPLPLRSKIELRITDVTTFAASLMESIHAEMEASKSAEDAFARMDKLFANPRTDVLPIRLPRSDFIVSSLVASELFRYPLSYAERLLQIRHGVKIGQWPGFDSARDKLQHLIIADHFKIVAGIAKPGAIVYFADTTERAPAYTRISPAARKLVEAGTSPDLRKLKLIGAGDNPSLLYGRLCHGHYGAPRETEAFEVLLNAYEASAEKAFEPLLPLEFAREQWGLQDLSEIGKQHRWWWLQYPCAIIHSPGAFRVRSWVLRFHSVVK